MRARHADGSISRFLLEDETAPLPDDGIVGLNAEAALRRRGFEEIRVETGRKLLFFLAADAPALDLEALQRVVGRKLANPVVEETMRFFSSIAPRVDEFQGIGAR